MHFAVRALAVAALAVATLSSARADDRANDGGTLYARLGGAVGVDAVAAVLIDRVVADPRTARSFRNSNLARVKKHLGQQLCQLAGGRCAYEGDSMREVHAGQDISEAEFYAMVEILEDVLRERGIATADRNALLAKLAPMKRDVVRVEPGAP